MRPERPGPWNGGDMLMEACMGAEVWFCVAEFEHWQKRMLECGDRN